MTGAERGFLLLGSQLGNPERRPLSAAAMRRLAQRASLGERTMEDRELCAADLVQLGYDSVTAKKILSLLNEGMLLDCYLEDAKRTGCVPLTRISTGYPMCLRQRLGDEAPGVLWTKGDVEILKMPKVSLVGSRDIDLKNKAFAVEVGFQAAKQGFALVSGNARGADKAAQRACLDNGGCVISVVADELAAHRNMERILYVSEENFDAPFSAQRALSRNRVIHGLGEKTFVAQCSCGTGGTWNGTVKNLKSGWSPVFCFDDSSAAARQLEQMGAQCISIDCLSNLNSLTSQLVTFFDQ